MRKTININGYEFSYAEQGEGSAVLFIHGSLLDWRYWQREFQYFSKDYKVVALSRRHHWPNAPSADSTSEFTYRVEEQIHDVIAFIEALGYGPVHLVGHSYGGYIAASIACSRPELLTSLVLMEPGGPIQGGAETASNSDDLKHGAELVSRGETEKGVALFLDAVCLKPKWQAGSADYKAMTLSNAATLIEQIKEIRPELQSELLKKIPCPTLLMMGEHALSPFPELVDSLAELIPESQKLVIDNASHMMNLDNFEQCARSLNTFFNTASTSAPNKHTS